PPKRGLVTVDTAPGGRDPDRASSVSAFGEWNEAVCDCGGTAAGGTAGIAGGVEGIARRNAEVVVARPAQADRRLLRPPDQHGARPLDALREHAVEVQHVVGERANASKGGRPARLEVEQVLDRDGYTMQRSHPTTRANGLVCGRGCLSGFL